ncbi:Crp/Fnr family transcriptional regulator [Rhizobium sp. TRM96647]|uniref:Crp/Fnr family transcriptional regulator n=1 Tax=unclassified Rhizobium TaxID=2613769 RepID=UPI0021E8C23B|nr:MULTISPECIES: Crp/Fnr family transcriptional regulator [unclassified Rhizobium]MCV3739289.1 Crp/Fnr family transcriptional regulator [Rhizobium sp. TRM96647]MCV3760961.1 Crp/Fnr family transcriptional regulator [Rhizobium sp. TRM96650]
MINSLIANLRARDVVTNHEEDLLRSIAVRDRRFSINEDLVKEGSRPTFSTLLVDGFAARYKIVDDGSRQITALHIAGDFVDLHAFPLKKMDHGILALSPCHVALVDHSDLLRVTETEPHLTRLLWLLTLVDGAIHREWIVAMGRRSKKSHLAHLFCELLVRLNVVGRVTEGSFSFPLTQYEMADILGISLVHLNKTLKLLRSENALQWTQRTVTVLDADRLEKLAEFDPDYLNLHREPR